MIEELRLDLGSDLYRQMTEPPVADTLKLLKSDQFMAATRKRFAAAADPKAEAEARAQAVVDQAVADGKIRADDAGVWTDVMSKAGDMALLGRRWEQLDRLAAELQSRPARAVRRAVRPVRPCLDRTDLGGPAGPGRGRRRGRPAGAGRTRKFSAGPVDQDAEFLERTMRSTPTSQQCAAGTAA